MRNKVIDLLDQTIEELDKEKIDGILEIPPKDDMGDFAFPCFQLAKVFRKAPNMIATEIAEKIPALKSHEKDLLYFISTIPMLDSHLCARSGKDSRD